MTRFTLRLNDEVYQKLLKIAEKEKRSLNSQIEYALEKFVESLSSSEKS